MTGEDDIARFDSRRYNSKKSKIGQNHLYREEGARKKIVITSGTSVALFIYT